MIKLTPSLDLKFTHTFLKITPSGYALQIVIELQKMNVGNSQFRRAVYFVELPSRW